MSEDTLAVALARLGLGESVTAITRHLGIGRSTLYRALELHLAGINRDGLAAS